jgi:hypothetical protein
MNARTSLQHLDTQLVGAKHAAQTNRPISGKHVTSFFLRRKMMQCKHHSAYEGTKQDEAHHTAVSAAAATSAQTKHAQLRTVSDAYSELFETRKVTGASSRISQQLAA